MAEHFDPRIKFCQKTDNHEDFPVGTRLENGAVVINSEASTHWMGERIDICYSEAERKCNYCGWRINCRYYKNVTSQTEGR